MHGAAIMNVEIPTRPSVNVIIDDSVQVHKVWKFPTQDTPYTH